MTNKTIAKKRVGEAHLILKLGDLTKETTDAIVNAANNRLLPGGGVSGAIYRAAGQIPFDECQQILTNENIQAVPTGSARLTGPGNLPVKAIIHTIGPQGTGDTELKNAYLNSLKLATEHSLQSIAFPSISTGIYAFPIEPAATIALTTVHNFLTKEKHTLKEVCFVFLDDNQTADIYMNAFNIMIQ